MIKNVLLTFIFYSCVPTYTVFVDKSIDIWYFSIINANLNRILCKKVKSTYYNPKKLDFILNFSGV